ncbi:MAG: dihydroorotase family protein [Gammaproteobacteria bacterium]
MLTFKNAKSISGELKDLSVSSNQNETIDASKLTIFPGLIDPHVHFRTPGLEHKEDWRTAAKAAIAGGYTMVFDMPNTIPPTVTKEILQEKKQIIDQQLKEVDIPLRYELFFGADKQHFDQIHRVQDQIIGIKVFMGCSTGNLVIDDNSSLHAIFAIASKFNLLIAVHAEDEHLMQERKKLFTGKTDYSIHSEIRNREVAARAVEKAIYLSKLYSVKLYLLHTSTQDEMELIKKAKQDGLLVYAETSPHHLFLNTSFYERLKGRALMNPPLREKQDQDALWQAIHDNVIDTIGSDHAPHTLDEKSKPYGECPSGVPGIETMLPLLITAYHEGLLPLEKIVSLTSTRPREIFNLPETNDFVLVDLEMEKLVSDANLQTKCHWSPFSGMNLKGWPVYVCLRDRVLRITS